MKKITFTGESTMHMGNAIHNVKAELGMEVAIHSTNDYKSHIYGKIIKITPKGFIDVEWGGGDTTKTVYQYRFDKNGTHCGGGYVDSSFYKRSYLVDANDARQEDAYNKARWNAIVLVEAIHAPNRIGSICNSDTLMKIVDDLEDKIIAAKAAVLALKTMENSNKD